VKSHLYPTTLDSATHGGKKTSVSLEVRLAVLWERAASMESAPNDTIEVEAGQEFVVALEGNLSRSYRGRFFDLPDGDFPELLGSEYTGPEDERMGAGGEEVLTFRAVSPGTTRMLLAYERPWGEDVVPMKTRAFAIAVNQLS
jgi:predicted secreted protein